MKRLLIPLALLRGAPSSALAGGWATAALAARRRRRGGGHVERAGEHPPARRDPCRGVSPTVTIRNESTGEAKTFDAKPTDEAGVYVAKVVFRGGQVVVRGVRRLYAVRRCEDHTFGSVDIGTGGGEACPPSGSSGSSAWRSSRSCSSTGSRVACVRAPAPAS